MFLPLKRLFKKHYIIVFEHPEHLNLPHYSLLSDLILIRLLELLDGNYMRM